MKARISFATVLVCAVSLGGFAPVVHAYLDPSTGSIILSAIVGIFATLGLALKTYWYKFKSFFKSDDTPAADAQSRETAAADSKPQSSDPG